ncbi:MAG: PEGA domain-containing protein [Muribaculum sp.]|nr:PEGA domain-containing protein [Muribaculum sp.]
MSAQDKLRFSIESFNADPFDYSAKDKKYEKFDGNGERYAIIKVTSNSNDNLREYNFNFGNLKHEVEVHDDALWVYVQKNAKLLTISREGYTSINKYDLHTTLESGKNYTLKLSAQPKKIYWQMTQFNVTPADSHAMITYRNTFEGSQNEMFGTINESGSVAKNLPLGSYSYQVISDNYKTAEGIFTLNDRKHTYIENVTLIPNHSKITLLVESGADIYVNDEFMGMGKWSGSLKAGDYQVECRLPNHSTTTQILHIEDNNDQIITLEAPTPILGEASVISNPLGANIIIDGKQYGITPRNIDLPLGKHVLELTMEGYKSSKMNFEIAENIVSEINMMLKEDPKNLDSDNFDYYNTSNQTIDFNDGIPIVMDLAFDDYGYIKKASDYKWHENAIMTINCLDDMNIANSGKSLYAIYTSQNGWMLYNFNKKDISGVPLQNIRYDESLIFDKKDNYLYSSARTKPVYVDRFFDENGWAGIQSIVSYREGKFYLTATLQPATTRLSFVSDKKPQKVEYQYQKFDNKGKFKTFTENLYFDKGNDSEYHSEFIYTEKIPRLKIGSTLYGPTSNNQITDDKDMVIQLPSSKITTNTWITERFNNEYLLNRDILSGSTGASFRFNQGETFYIDLLKVDIISDVQKISKMSRGFKSKFGINVSLICDVKLSGNNASAEICFNAVDSNQQENKADSSVDSGETHLIKSSGHYAFNFIVPNESLSSLQYYPYLKLAAGPDTTGKLTITHLSASNF